MGPSWDEYFMLIAKLVKLKHCGHIPPEEEAGETNRAVEAFLKK